MVSVRIALAVALSVLLGACDRLLGIDGEYTVEPHGSSSVSSGDDSTVTTGAVTTAGAGTSTSTGGAGGDDGGGGDGGGGDGAGGAGGAPEPIDCDPADPGPLVDGCPVGMVRVDATYCIGAREVSFGDYDAVASRAAECFEEGALAACSGNDPFSFNESAFAAADPDFPAHPLDFCDAETYCRVRGWRMCTQAEWRFACTPDPGSSPFPWGASPVANRCVEYPDIASVTRDDACSGDEPPRIDVHDLVGNVAETFAGCGDPLGCLAGGAVPEVAATDPERCEMAHGVPFKDLIYGEDPRPMPVDYRLGARCCFGP